MRIDLIKQNYLVASQFMSVAVATEYAQTFREHVTKFNVAGDPQVPNSRAVTNFPLFVRHLVASVSQVSALIGEAVLPTYCYARQYLRGAILSSHRDRAACEISLTITLHASIPVWQVGVQDPTGQIHCMELPVGDALLYLGCQADHWRVGALSDAEHIQVFFHYVRATGPKAWAFFDKQQQQNPTPQTDTIPVAVFG